MKNSVHNEQPVLTEYLQDSESQLPQPFNRLPYSNAAKNFVTVRVFRAFSNSLTAVQLQGPAIPSTKQEARISLLSADMLYDYLTFVRLASQYNCV